MKKLLALFIIGIMVFGTGAVSFASGEGDTNMNQKNKSFTVSGERVKTDAKDMMHKNTTPPAIKAHFTEAEKTTLSSITSHIKTNQKELNVAIKDILKKLHAIKQTLKTSDVAISFNTISTMTTFYETLGIARKDINVNMHPGVIKNEIIKMKYARAHTNFVATEAYLNNVIKAQEDRLVALADLSKIIPDYTATTKDLD